MPLTRNPGRLQAWKTIIPSEPGEPELRTHEWLRVAVRARRTGATDGALNRALQLAEPEGYVRIFVDEGPPLAALLQACARQGPRPATFVGR